MFIKVNRSVYIETIHTDFAICAKNISMKNAIKRTESSKLSNSYKSIAIGVNTLIYLKCTSVDLKVSRYVHVKTILCPLNL